MGLVSSTLALCAAPLQQRECAEPESHDGASIVGAEAATEASKPCAGGARKHRTAHCIICFEAFPAKELTSAIVRGSRRHAARGTKRARQRPCRHHVCAACLASMAKTAVEDGKVALACPSPACRGAFASLTVRSSLAGDDSSLHRLAELTAANASRAHAERADADLLKLARARGWRQCPACAHMIERSFGCNSVYCRCGTLFCYGCGSAALGCYCRFHG